MVRVNMRPTPRGSFEDFMEGAEAVEEALLPERAAGGRQQRTNSDDAPNYRIGANHSYTKVSPNHAKRVDKFARLLENGEEDHAA